MKWVYISKKQVDETLAVEPTIGKKNLEPFLAFAKANNLPFSILEDHQVMTNNAEVHLDEADLWLCLEGEATFVCDGELVEPWFNKSADGVENKRELRAKTIKSGTTYKLKPSDWLWIPVGVSHQHSAATTARLVIIKILPGKK